MNTVPIEIVYEVGVTCVYMFGTVLVAATVGYMMTRLIGIAKKLFNERLKLR
jgi:hypothetical protein